MSDESSEPEAQPTPVTIACGCNYTCQSPEIVPEPRYTLMGTLTLIWGVTARPKAIDYRCAKCGKTIHSARDEKTIREFIH